MFPSLYIWFADIFIDFSFKFRIRNLAIRLIHLSTRNRKSIFYLMMRYSADDSYQLLVSTDWSVWISQMIRFCSFSLFEVHAVNSSFDDFDLGHNS